MRNKKIIALLFILVLFLTSFKNISKNNFQMQSDDFYFSINEVDNFIIKDYFLYTKNGKFEIDSRNHRENNDYYFDLIYKNKVIGMYSDSETSGCDLFTNYNSIKRELGLYDFVYLKKFDEKLIVQKVKEALLKYPAEFYSSPEILNNKGYFLYQNKYHDAALLYFNKVIEKFPNRVVAYLNRADCQWELKEKEKAKRDYKKYVQLMKEQKKDLKKIPDYVYERIKE